jgi:hypothetical protein
MNGPHIDNWKAQSQIKGGRFQFQSKPCFHLFDSGHGLLLLLVLGRCQWFYEGGLEKYCTQPIHYGDIEFGQTTHNRQIYVELWWGEVTTTMAAAQDLLLLFDRTNDFGTFWKTALILKTCDKVILETLYPTGPNEAHLFPIKL